MTETETTPMTTSATTPQEATEGEADVHGFNRFLPPALNAVLGGLGPKVQGVVATLPTKERIEAGFSGGKVYIPQ